MTKIEPVGYVHECDDYTMSIIKATPGEHPCPVAVYTEAQMRQLAEACAVACEEVVTYPAGHGGQFEGYGPVKTTRSGAECASAIRILIKEMLG